MKPPSTSSRDSTGAQRDFARYMVGAALLVLVACVGILLRGVMRRPMSNAPLPPPPIYAADPDFGVRPVPQIVDIPSYHQATPLNPESGGAIFKAKNKIFSLPCFDHDSMYFGACDGNFYCLNKTAGELRWTYEGLKRVDSAPVLYRDLVCFATYGELIALRKTTGELAWKTKVLGLGYHNPTVHSERILISGTDHVAVVDASSGDIVHTYPFKGAGGAVAIGDDHVVVVVNTDIEADNYTGEAKLLCFKHGAGEPVWTITLGGCCLGSVQCDEERCYLGDRSGNFLGVDLSDGHVSWRFDCHPLFDNRNNVWADRGVLMNGSNVVFSVHHQNMGEPAAIVAVDKASGQKAWSVTSAQTTANMIAKTGNSIVTVTEDRTLVFIDADTGELQHVGAIPKHRSGGEFAGVRIDGENVYTVGGDQKVWRFKFRLPDAAKSGARN